MPHEGLAYMFEGDYIKARDTIPHYGTNIMNTATIKTSDLSTFTPTLGTRIDEFIGSLLSVKPSVIAACFSSAMTASNTIGAEELSRVSSQRIQSVRREMGLDG
jgi:hypothetical protein